MCILWKDVVGYEGYYEVSNTGEVRSKNRKIVRSDGTTQYRKGRKKSDFENHDGYLVVKLSRDGIDKTFGVHILVAKAFVEGYQPGYEVNHKDYDRKNNKASNLEWVSHTDNISHTLKGGRHITQVRDMSGKNNPNYGNRKLSKKYTNDPSLSKEKQGRPGAQNGRSKPTVMLLSDGSTIEFPYIIACAQYLISNKIVRSRSVSNVSVMVSDAARNGREYYGYKFFINN